MKSHTGIGMPLLAALALALAGCAATDYIDAGDNTMEGRTAVPTSAYGPITTYPIVTTQRVPQGTTPTGATGYAMANSARTNATIVEGTAAVCGPENTGGDYDIACAEAAGLPGTVTPYRNAP